MPTVNEILEKPPLRQALIDDAVVLLDEEVASRSGLSGLAVKAGFGTVKALKPGIIRDVTESLLPEFARALDPIITERPDDQRLAPYLQSRTDDVVRALLGVTDQRARQTTHQTLVKAYNRLRPTAEKQVAMSVPRLSRMLERHLDVPAAA